MTQTSTSFLRFLPLIYLITASGIGTGCMPQPVETIPSPRAEIVRIPIVVTPRIDRAIPKDSRIVIANIEGDCSQEVKDALMQRLIDNTDYNVLDRDNLKRILSEADFKWSGDFDSEMSVNIGKLLGASFFIVGRVAYCGPVVGSTPEETLEGRVTITALLQLIDLQSGRVLLSSASEGTYIPSSSSLLMAENAFPGPTEDSTERPGALSPTEKEVIEDKAKEGPGEKKGIVKRGFKGGLRAKKAEKAIEKANYPKLKAAEDMANSFADKFFGRPTWENAEMWKNPFWHYGDSIRYVKLGNCPAAVELLESVGSQEVDEMPDEEVAEYLHNFGVALLCANMPERAMSKLRSAYRVRYDPTTLEMIELAAKILEWSLDVEVDTEPEMRILLERQASY